MYMYADTNAPFPEKNHWPWSDAAFLLLFHYSTNHYAGIHMHVPATIYNVLIVY